MFALPYRPGPPAAQPALNEDPGWIRFEPFFRKMYGDCTRGEVKRHLRAVRWLGGGTVEVTTVTASPTASKMWSGTSRLPDTLKSFLVPSAGTFNCRPIAGTKRWSMHAYGAAIDIGTRFADYWRWARPSGGAIPYANRIPFEIVEVFERHGFIWGGKWYHYDTMHFEYRPELLR